MKSAAELKREQRASMAKRGLVRREYVMDKRDVEAANTAIELIKLARSEQPDLDYEPLWLLTLKLDAMGYTTNFFNRGK